MTQSKKHHYIPRFYLAGFTDPDNSFFVFDKKTERIWQASPENSFFENHRNTGELQHQLRAEVYRTDLPEEILSHFDGKAAPVIKAIRDSSSEEFALTPERLARLRMFILSIFWRTPVNDELRKSIIRDFPYKSLGFGFFDKSGNRNTEMDEMFKKVDLFAKIYPALLPITSFRGKYNAENGNDWKLYYNKEDFHVVTDNPIIYPGFKDFSSLHEDVLFPVSSNRLLVSTKKYKPHILAPVFSLNLDLLLFMKAGRYIASSNKKYLEFLAAEAKNNLLKPGWVTLLQETVFNSFY